MRTIWHLDWLRVSAVFLFFAALRPLSAGADLVTLGPLTFSDELGGFSIRSGSGSGTQEDPFVIVEEIHEPTGAILLIRNLRPEVGNLAKTFHGTGFRLRKVVHNRTGKSWRAFDIELREVKNQPSGYLDWLSFSQVDADLDIATSDRFAEHALIREPRDTIAFTKGEAGHGEFVVFTMTVTHASPSGAPVYLLQRPKAWMRKLSMRHLSAESGRND